MRLPHPRDGSTVPKIKHYFRQLTTNKSNDLGWVLLSTTVLDGSNSPGKNLLVIVPSSKKLAQTKWVLFNQGVSIAI